MRHTTLGLVVASTLVFGACSDRSGLPTSATLSSPAAVSRSAGSTTNISVTTTFYDTDALGNLLLTRSDHANGTGFATYTNVNSVSRVVSSDGSAWRLFLGNQSARTLYLVRGSQGMAIPDGYYWQNTEAGSRCFDAANAVVNIRLMAVGASNGNCSFMTDFYYGGTKYKLAMSPLYSGTGRALVTCAAAAAGFCTSWKIVPNTNAASAGIANLYHFANNGSLVLDGVYRDSYSVAVTQ